MSSRNTNYSYADMFFDMHRSIFKPSRSRHIDYHQIPIGQELVLELRDEPTVKRVTVTQRTFESISYLMDGTNHELLRSDHGYKWRFWYREPKEKDRVLDTWR